MKDESGEKTMTDSVKLRQKTYSYLTDDNNEKKKERHKNVFHKMTA